MNAVDRFNKSLKSLGIRRPSKRWDRKLSVFILESIIHNSFMLLEKPHRRYCKADYLEDLVRCYLKKQEIVYYLHLCIEDVKQGRCVICYKNCIQ